jgi:hypothetical protein
MRTTPGYPYMVRIPVLCSKISQHMFQLAGKICPCITLQVPSQGTGSIRFRQRDTTMRIIDTQVACVGGWLLRARKKRD